MNKTQLLNHLKHFAIKQQTRSYFKKTAPKYIKGKVLDIGAGLNPFRELIKYEKYVTLDEDEKLKPDITGSIYAIPAEKEEFDSAVCTDVIEHLNEPLKALKEISRVVKKGGHLYLSAPFIWNLHYEPNDYFRYTKYGLQHLMEQAGFKVIKIKGIGGIWAFIGARLARLVYAAVKTVLFFLPKINIAIAVLASLPFSFVFWILSLLLDRFSKCPITFAAVGEKAL